MTVPTVPNGPLSLRRAVFALLVGGLTLFVTVGVVGFAAAADEASSALPETYQVPSPRVGDQGNYTVAQVRIVDGTLRQDGPVRSSWEFAWGPGQVMRDARGEAHFTYPLASSLTPEARRTVFWDMSTHEAVADRVTQAWTNEGSTFAIGYMADWDVEYTYHLAPSSREAATVGLCGIHANAFQGAPASLDGPLELFPACTLMYGTGATRHVVSVGSRFEAVARERVDGQDAVVFLGHVSKHSSARTLVWMGDDTPYPLQILVLSDDGVQGTLIRLTQFRAGEGPVIAGAATVPGSPIPDLVWSPRTETGPAEGDVDHPFPLSQAYRLALEDAEGADLRRFLADHPRAAMMGADFDEWDSGDYHHTGWQMEFSDGEQELVVGYFRQVDTRAPMVSLLSDPVYYFQNRTNTNYEGPSRLHPDQVPASLPTIESMLASWRAFAGTTGPDARSWMFRFDCRDEACERPRARIAAGFEYGTASQPVTFPLVGDATRSGRTDMLELAFEPGSTSPTAVTRWVARSEFAYAAVAPDATPLVTGGSEIRPASYGAASSAWSLPTTGYALGAGFFAALVGLTYWLWPVLRSIGVGLFTRLERPALLENRTRREIMDLVEHNPGIHFAEITRRVGGGHGNMEHHLAHLTRQGLLMKVKAPGYTCFYRAGSLDAGAARAMPYLKADGARRILAAIQRAPGTTGLALAHELGLAPPSVSYHVKRLKAAGLVSVVRGSHGLELRATSLAARALAAVA